MAQAPPSPTSTSDGYTSYDINLPTGDCDTFDIPSEYVLEQYVGHGAVGLVCLARHLPTDSVVAIKKLRSVFADMVHTKRIIRELTLLKHYHNAQYIVKTHRILRPSRADYSDVYVVMDYYPSDLANVIRDVETTLTEPHIKWISYQLALALRTLHQTNCMHRDLKPQNILVTPETDVVLADFGLAKAYEVEDVAQSLYVVTRWYRPPELLVREPHYAAPVDVWSFGCVLGEMFLRTPLFAGRNQIDQLHQIMFLLGVPEPDVYADFGSEAARRYLDQLQKNRHVGTSFRDKFPMASEEAIDLLSKILVFHPDRRLSMQEVLEHPWYVSEYGPPPVMPEMDPPPPIMDPTDPDHARAIINALML
eukprot:PhF_6_TR5217/c0_g1_i1/m.7527